MCGGRVGAGVGTGVGLAGMVAEVIPGLFNLWVGFGTPPFR